MLLILAYHVQRMPEPRTPVYASHQIPTTAQIFRLRLMLDVRQEARPPVTVLALAEQRWVRVGAVATEAHCDVQVVSRRTPHDVAGIRLEMFPIAYFGFMSRLMTPKELLDLISGSGGNVGLEKFVVKMADFF
uniref:Uncharacterized protein n=1 Tax=Cacopsylla melanoneura TaxID=428564 RepID=A0A8D9BCM8_9HEMI